uniref:Wsv192-like protein n=1 Tax=Marsupenaeus japonicus endogenous nimavirus TaxID=2133793 RepID=A0A401IP83_9VIRU|nr:wsv192-like protein [Marsupenaeus japonicus endogenous nimavirus]
MVSMWSNIDDAIEHHITHNKINTNILYNERQQVAFITIFNYLNENVQSCFDKRKKIKRKIIQRAIEKYNTIILKRILILAREHAALLVKKKKNCSNDEKYCYDNAPAKELMCDRFLEHTDPEMEIWRRLQEEGCVNQDIEAEMRRVQHLLPKRVPIYNDKRSGPVTLSHYPNNDITKEKCENWINDIVAQVRCDDISVESNEISKLFCKNLMYDQGRRIKIPQYLRSLHIQCIDRKCFPNNYFKLLVILYKLFSPVAGSYMAIQCLISSIKKPLMLAVKNKKTIVQTISIIESALKKSTGKPSGQMECLNLFANMSSSNLKLLSQSPLKSSVEEEVQKDVDDDDDDKTRSILMSSVATVTLQKNEKDILLFLCGRIAEMDTDHPYLQLLTSCFSHALGRRVTPDYIFILLLNYIYKKIENPVYYNYLSLFSSKVGFCIKNGILTPLCGIGSGITKRKLRWLVCRLIEIVKHNYMVGIAPDTSTLFHDDNPIVNGTNSSPENINGIIGNFFDGLSISEPNEIEENGINFENDTRDRVMVNNNNNNNDNNNNNNNDDHIEQENNRGASPFKCECSCHIVENLKGKIIYPCQRRREIKEEVYERSLNLKPSLSLTFGICGYKHLLNNISNVKLDYLVRKQKLKERKTFVERESASKTNWYNLIHYLFVKKGDSKNILLNMDRTRVCRLSKFIVQCEHLSDILCNLEFKFNSSLLPLGYKENIFMKLKYGRDIVAHATNCWREACLHKGWIEKTISENAPPDWVIGMPRNVITTTMQCVTGVKRRSHLSNSRSIRFLTETLNLSSGTMTF